MFMGEYNHTIDDKGRIIMPSKFRDGLSNEFVITRGMDCCLAIYNRCMERNYFTLPTTT